MNESLRNTLLAAHLKYNKGLSQKEIALQLVLSDSSISRMLLRSPKYVKCEYTLPREESCEISLIDKFELTDAIVVEAGSEEIETQIIGQTATKYFTKHVENNNIISLSNGKTLAEMVHSLNLDRERTVEIYQLSLESHPESIHESSLVLAGLIRAKSSSDSKVYGFQMPPRKFINGDARIKLQSSIMNSSEYSNLSKKVKKSDFIFVEIGTGQSPKNENENSGFYNMIREIIGETEYKKYVEELKIIGEINNQTYNIEGKNITKNILENNKFINILTLESMRELARDRRNHKVIGVATGYDKRDAVKTALENELVNVIITSRKIAEYLIE